MCQSPYSIPPRRRKPTTASTVNPLDLVILQWIHLMDTANWPLAEALPSYGRGRELPGGRYMSLIHGDGIQDVIITGNRRLCSLSFPSSFAEDLVASGDTVGDELEEILQMGVLSLQMVKAPAAIHVLDDLD